MSVSRSYIGADILRVVHEVMGEKVKGLSVFLFRIQGFGRCMGVAESCIGVDIPLVVGVRYSG